MKKIINLKFFMLLAIFIVPMLLLTACDEAQYFAIEVYKDGNGSVIGPNKYQKLVEDREITLFAEETDSDSPFICWIKDRSHVVSLDKEYTVKVNEETAGVYTALFSQDYSQMLYAALTNIYVNRPEVTDLNVTIKLIPVNASTEQREIFNKNITEQYNQVYDGTVFSFKLQDSFFVKIELDYMRNLVIPIHEEIGSFTLDRENFANGTFIINDNDEMPNVTLTFQMLSRSLVESYK